MDWDTNVMIIDVSEFPNFVEPWEIILMVKLWVYEMLYTQLSHYTYIDDNIYTYLYYRMPLTYIYRHFIYLVWYGIRVVSKDS